jgi:hypothetical protein
MKCPKCDYLGFETGDRCRHCGYDFSLATRVPDPADVSLRVSEEAPVAAVGDLWIREQGTEAAGIEDGGASVRVAAAGAYPLFPSIRPGDDEPLIRVPREPRAPLAVRRPAELPRIRPTPRGVRVPESSGEANHGNNDSEDDQLGALLILLEVVDEKLGVVLLVLSLRLEAKALTLLSVGRYLGIVGHSLCRSVPLRSSQNWGRNQRCRLRDESF